ncbi:hypothetical protein [Saccharothrix xinjiangensis]|uniref:Uncharacterized protein n=1 Tax=Saccharothrix xinjiangensis TaxID=204798 RepID=A0ABV9Y218_9PSEU
MKRLGDPAQELHVAVQQARAAIPDAPDVAETVVASNAAEKLADATRHAGPLGIGTRGALAPIARSWSSRRT